MAHSFTAKETEKEQEEAEKVKNDVAEIVLATDSDTSSWDETHWIHAVRATNADSQHVDE